MNCIILELSLLSMGRWTCIAIAECEKINFTILASRCWKWEDELYVSCISIVEFGNVNFIILPSPLLNVGRWTLCFMHSIAECGKKNLIIIASSLLGVGISAFFLESSSLIVGRWTFIILESPLLRVGGWTLSFLNRHCWEWEDEIYRPGIVIAGNGMMNFDSTQFQLNMFYCHNVRIIVLMLSILIAHISE